MDKSTTNISRPINLKSLILAMGVTCLVTLILMALSGLTEGFASGGNPANVSASDIAQRRMNIAIMIHLVTVIPAIPLGAYILWRPKGGAAHKALGRIWALLLLATAVSSFWIGRPGTGIAGTGFSFIHAFSVWTFFCIPYAVYCIRKGNIEGHLRAMQGLYIGLLIAGLFAFIPGRVLGSLVFG